MKLKLLFFLLLSFTFNTLHPKPIVKLSGSYNEYRLGKYLEYYRDQTGRLTINDIVSPKYSNSFKQSEKEVLNFGYTHDVIWLRFDIKGEYEFKKGMPWVIELKYPHINFIDYYLFSDQSVCIDSAKTGSLRSITHQYPIFIFKPRKHHIYTFYLRLQSKNSLIIPLNIYSAKEFIRQHHKENLLSGLFFGIMLVMLFINLFAYYSLKDKSYLYFALFIITFLIYYLSNSGFSGFLLWPEHLKWNFISIPLFVALSNTIFIIFADSFLQAKKYLPKWHKIYLASISVSLSLIIGLFFFDYLIIITLIILLSAINLFIVLIPVAISWKNGSKASGLFLFSLSGLTLGMLEYILSHVGIISGYIFLESGMMYGSLIFVIFMSFSLRSRIMTLVKEKEEIDKSLQISEQKLRSIVETTRDIIWEVDREGKYTYISPTFEIIMGYTPGECIGKYAFDFMPQKEKVRVRELYKKRVSKGESFIQLENTYISKSGAEVILESSGVPFFDDKYNLLGYRGIARDITARKRAVEKKEESERNLRALLNATVEVAFLIDADYRIITGNEALTKLLNKNLDEIIGKSALEFLPEHIVQIRKKKLEEAATTGKAVRWEDGDINRWWDNNIYPILDEHNKTTNIAVFSIDITKRKQAEILHEVMLNIANAVFITKNTHELYKTIHKEISKLIDARNFFVGLYDSKEKSITMAYIVDEKDNFNGIKIPIDKTLSAQVIQTKKAMLFTRKDMIELDLKGLTGSGYGTPSMSWMGVPLLDDSDKVMGVIVIQNYSLDNAFSRADLSLMEFVSKQISMSIMKKQAEEKIHILSQSIEQNPTIIMITDTDGYIEYVNPRFTEVTGYSFKEAVGKKPNILKSGETPQKVYKELWEKITNGYDWKGEFHNKKKNGDYYWEYTHISPIKDEEGHIAHYLALKEDVSEQKKLQQQVIQSQRMEAIGTLAGGIAHDFNNLLTVIKGFSEIALLKTTNSTPVHKDIQAILSASQKAEKLTKQILAFSRKQIYQPKIISINNIITELQGMIHRLIGEDISMELDLYDNLPMIKADPSQIEQILMNLVINARDAINQKDNNKEDKKIVIRSRIASQKEISGKEFELSMDNSYIAFSVSDSGTGIPENIKQYIFDPFFTTKETGKGTGLGLATVYGIVKQNNGFILFNSALNKGSEFIIYWPVSSETASEENELSDTDSKLDGHETILFVEDDQNLLKFGETVLQEFGYKVITATNGKQALEFLAKNDKTDLLITDFIMPDINGMELSDSAREIKPDLNIIVMSGYEPGRISETDHINFLQKPFSVNLLLSKVREILDKK